MKKAMCIIMALVLVIGLSGTAAAHSDSGSKSYGYGSNSSKSKGNNQSKKVWNMNTMPGMYTKSSYRYDYGTCIKYGRNKLSLSVITKGMGAKAEYSKKKSVLTVSKDSSTIVIDFKNKTVTVNSIADPASGIFEAGNDKKMKAVIQYVAKVLGIEVSCSKDKVTVAVPKLDAPTGVKVKAVGGTIVANTLNSTNTALTASAAIKAGQAAGGKAELYVGDKLVAVDTEILEKDTQVTFSTAAAAPTNIQLQALVNKGGKVTVKLYNANGKTAVSKASCSKLAVDYKAPAVTSVSGAALNLQAGTIEIYVNGEVSKGDKADVTLISLYDYTLNKEYKLTDTKLTDTYKSGSYATVKESGKITICLGKADISGLAGFGTGKVRLTVAAGSLLTDAAGNASPVHAGFTAEVTVK